MDYWGFRSYDNDDTADALDAAYEQVHGAVYDDLMDDRNPLTFEQVQEKLASESVLAAALAWLKEEYQAENLDEWDAEDRLAFIGMVVRMLECKVKVPTAEVQRALEWLQQESLEWDEPTQRRLRRDQEIRRLQQALSDAQP